jgi:hypothetical protein
MCFKELLDLLALDCQIQGQNRRICQSGGSNSLKSIKSLT